VSTSYKEIARFGGGRSISYDATCQYHPFYIYWPGHGIPVASAEGLFSQVTRNVEGTPELEHLFRALDKDQLSFLKRKVAVLLGPETKVAELEKQLEAEQAYTNKLTSLLKQADEAMAWNLGGEPIDTLMLKARKDIKAVLESTDKLEKGTKDE